MVFNRGSVLEKPEAPVLQRPGIMTAHHLHIGDFQAPPVGRANELFYRRQMATREYIFCQPAIYRCRFAMDRDGADHGDAVSGKWIGHLFEKGAVISWANMSQHAD